MKNRLILFLFFALLLPSFASPKPGVTLPLGEPVRGGAFVVDIVSQPDVAYFTVQWQGLNIELPASYNTDMMNSRAKIMLPAEYENSGNFPLRVTAYTGDGNELVNELLVTVNDKDYPKVSLKVDPKFVNPPPESLDRIARERELTAPALRTFSAERMWELPFKRPRDTALSGVFGEFRLYNGEPRNKHGGVDFRGPAGGEIWAIADGKVILTGDFYYNGRFVFVDHGQGVVSAYLHMSEIIVKQGDDVKKGDTLGLVGATGRVTGPHLHLSLYVQGIAVDALPFLE